MKRKFLEDLGLTKEQVDAVMAENGSDIEAAKGDLAAVTAERDKLKKDVSDRDEQLDGLKKTAGDNEALTKQIADLQAENKAAKEKFEADMKDLRLSNAIKLAIGESAHDADLVAGLVDRSKLVLGEDGKVSGLEEQMKAIRKDKGFLFKETKPGSGIKGGKPAEGKGGVPEGKKPAEMTYEELCAYMEANPGAALE